MIRAKTPCDRGTWTVLLLLLLAVLIPTACVQWFMSLAVRNERLAVRILTGVLTDAAYAGSVNALLRRQRRSETERLRFGEFELDLGSHLPSAEEGLWRLAGTGRRSVAPAAVLTGVEANG